MAADDFAARLCLSLMQQNAFLADSEPHRMIEQAAKELFVVARKELRAEWEAEQAARLPD